MNNDGKEPKPERGKKKMSYVNYEVPEELKKKVTIHPVRYLNEVLDIVLVGWKEANLQKKYVSSSPVPLPSNTSNSPSL